MNPNKLNRQLSSSPTGMSADKWLQSRKNSQTNQEPSKYSFMNDSSSDDSYSVSRFIKKDATKTQPSAETSNRGLTKTFKSVEDIRPKTSRGKEEPQVSKTVQSRSAVNRFAELEKQIMSRHKIEKVSLSVSDLDISSDFEIRKEAEDMREERKQAANQQFTFLGDENSASEEMDLKFVKSSQQKLTSSAVDSVEKTGSLKKTVSFASNLVQDSPSERSLDDFLPSHPSSADDISSLDDILPASGLQNLRTLDELYPDEELEGSQTDLFNLHTVDELFESNQISEESSMTVSEGGNFFNIHSVEELEEPKELGVPPQNQSPVQEKEKSTPVQSVFHAQKSQKLPSKLITPNLFKATEVVRESLEGVSEVDEYTDEFHSSDDTLKDTESITQDIETETSRSSSSPVTISSHSTSVAQDVIASYTESFEPSTETDSIPPTKQKKASKQNNVSIQTEPLKIFQPTSNIQDISPADKMLFEPSRLLNNETLATLTTYSPAVLALQDMMKQQLAFTRDFISRSENLHKAATESLVPDYQYSTLEEARQLIRTYRAK